MLRCLFGFLMFHVDGISADRVLLYSTETKRRQLKVPLQEGTAGAALQVAPKGQRPFLPPKGRRGTDLPGSKLRRVWNLA